MNFLKTISSKIIALTLVLISALIILTLFELHSKWKSYVVIQDQSKNIELMIKMSKMVTEIQKERGKSSIFLNKKLSMEKITAQRLLVDKQKNIFLKTLKKKAFPNLVKSRLGNSLGKIQNLRADINGGISPKESLRRYTEIIKTTLNLGKIILSKKTAKGIGKRIFSVFTLELAKESSGLLRGTLAAVLSKNVGIDIEILNKLISLKSSLKVNLHAPFLTFTDQTINKIKQFSDAEHWKTLDKAVNTVLHKFNEGDYGIESTENFAVMTKVVNDVGGLIVYELDQMNKYNGRVKNKIINSLITTVVIIIVFLLVIFFIAYKVISSIRSEIRFVRTSISDSIQEFMKGNIDILIDSKNIGIDFQSMVEQLNKLMSIFSNLMQNIIKVMELVASHNLRAELTGNYSGELSNLKDNINSTITELSDIIKNLKNASSKVQQSSGEISSSAQALAQGATEQASSLEEITSTMNIVGDQVKQNAKNVQAAKQLGELAKNSASAGNEKMKKMIISMEEITKSSENISKVMKVIDEIAFQTNLLALNAAVEAARAGKHGKGFAVVSEEVRNLAERSAKAAKETQEMMDESNRKVAEGAHVAKETASNLDEIVQNSIKVSNLLNDIAAASEEQRNSVSQIVDALDQVDQVTQKNAATAEESSSSSIVLSDQANDLKKQTDIWKI